MIRLTAVLVALATTACGTPVPRINLDMSNGSEQSCGGSCSDVDLPCDAVMSIRIVDPDDPYNPDKRYLDQCVRVLPDKAYDACSLHTVNLDQTALPVQDLEVQIAVFAGAALAVDPENGDPVCPDVMYSAANGFPVQYGAVPALGGRAYYHPGDEIVRVVLGCTDQSAMNAGVACNNPKNSVLTATVTDFETRVPVLGGPGGVADLLTVSIGEPHSFDGGFVLNPTDAIPLRLDGEEEFPKWSAANAQTFTKYACVQVREDVPQSVATLRCLRAGDPLPPLEGIRLQKSRLQTILGTLGVSPSEFPSEGLTIGIVVDAQFNGVENYVVAAMPATAGAVGGTVTYLSGGPGAPIDMTSKNGIFVSRDAPFGTIFSARGQTQMTPAVGGLVAGKVTFVVISPMIGEDR